MRQVRLEQLCHQSLRGATPRELLVAILLPLVCDDLGSFKLEPERIASTLFPHGQYKAVDVSASIEELVSTGLIQIYSEAGVEYGHIRAWNDWKVTDGSGRAAYPQPPGPVLRIDIANEVDAQPALLEVPVKNFDALPDAGAAPPSDVPTNAAEVKMWARWLALRFYLSVLARYEMWGKKCPERTRFPTKSAKQAWITSMRLMMTSEQESPASIYSMMLFAHEDDFWQFNILSPDTMRRQWAKLLAAQAKKTARAKQPNNWTYAQPPPTAEEDLDHLAEQQLGKGWRERALEHLS